MATKRHKSQQCPKSNIDSHYYVEAIKDKRINCNNIEYLVKWQGYKNEENTWEPFTNICHLSESLFETVDKNFDRRNRNKKNIQVEDLDQGYQKKLIKLEEIQKKYYCEYKDLHQTIQKIYKQRDNKANNFSNKVDYEDIGKLYQKSKSLMNKQLKICCDNMNDQIRKISKETIYSCFPFSFIINPNLQYKNSFSDEIEIGLQNLRQCDLFQNFLQEINDENDRILMMKNIDLKNLSKFLEIEQKVQECDNNNILDSIYQKLTSEDEILQIYFDYEIKLIKQKVEQQTITSEDKEKQNQNTNAQQDFHQVVQNIKEMNKTINYQQQNINKIKESNPKNSLEIMPEINQYSKEQLCSNQHQANHSVESQNESCWDDELQILSQEINSNDILEEILQSDNNSLQYHSLDRIQNIEIEKEKEDEDARDILDYDKIMRELQDQIKQNQETGLNKQYFNYDEIYLKEARQDLSKAFQLHVEKDQGFQLQNDKKPLSSVKKQINNRKKKTKIKKQNKANEFQQSNIIDSQDTLKYQDNNEQLQENQSILPNGSQNDNRKQITKTNHQQSNNQSYDKISICEYQNQEIIAQSVTIQQEQQQDIFSYEKKQESQDYVKNQQQVNIAQSDQQVNSQQIQNEQDKLFKKIKNAKEKLKQILLNYQQQMQENSLSIQQDNLFKEILKKKNNKIKGYMNSLREINLSSTYQVMQY